MDFESLLDFTTSDQNEAEKARRLQRSETEVARYTLPESVTDDVARAQLCLRGQPTQRLAALGNVAQLVCSEGGSPLSAVAASLPSSAAHSSGSPAESVADKLVPLICAMLGGQPDANAPQERLAALQALRDVCNLKILPAGYVTSKMLPAALRVITTGRDRDAGAPEETSAAVDVILTCLETGTCTQAWVVGELLPAATSMATVSSVAWQRSTSARILAAILVHAPPPSAGGGRAFVDLLLGMCQDVDSGVRRCMASLLGAIIPSIAGPSRRASFSGEGDPGAGMGLLIKLRDRCVEELAELLDDEDVTVKAAAVATTAAVYDSSLSGVPVDARRTRLLGPLRRLWEGANLGPAMRLGEATPGASPNGGTPAAMADKDNPLRRAFAEHAGWLLYCGVQQGDMGVPDSGYGFPVGGTPSQGTGPKTMAELGRQASVQRRGSFRGLVQGVQGPSPSPEKEATPSSPVVPGPGAALPPSALSQNRRRSMTRRFSAEGVDGMAGRWDGGSGGPGHPALVLSSLLACFGSLVRHPDAAMRHTCARGLPGMVITCMSALGSVPLPAYSLPQDVQGGPGQVSAPSAAKIAKLGLGATTAKAPQAKEAAGPASAAPGKAAFVALFQEDASASADPLLQPPSPGQLTSPNGSGIFSPTGETPQNKAAVFTAVVREILLPALFALCGDPDPHVRVCVVKGLVHIAAALGHNRACRLLGPLYIALLQDGNAEVVGTVVDTAPTWLALLCSAEHGLRMTLFASLVPLLFAAADRPVVTHSWRRQLAWLAALRMLPFVYPAPHVAEAALTAALAFISRGACRPVQAAAVHTIVWYLRHGPTGRVRGQVKDFLGGRMNSAKSTLETVTSIVAQMQTGSGTGSSSSITTDGEGRGKGDMVGEAGRAAMLVSVGAGIKLPLGVLVQQLAMARVSAPMGQAGPPLELLGPSWKRLLALEACTAALWLFSRSYVAAHFLPVVVEAATGDPTAGVRLAAVRILAGLRTWFVLPADSRAVGSIVGALDRATGDVDRTVAKAALDGLACLRRIDAAVSTAVGSPGLGLGNSMTLALLCEQFSPSLRPGGQPPQQAGAAASAVSAAAGAAAGAIAGRRRSSISSAAIGALRGNAAGPSDSAAPRPSAPVSSVMVIPAGDVPNEAVRLAAMVAALTYAHEHTYGRGLLSSTARVNDARKDIPAGSVPPRLHTYVDGWSAVADSPSLLRNPFREGVTGQLPSLPTSSVPSYTTVVSCFPTARGSGSLEDLTSEGRDRLGAYSAGLLPLDDVVGLATATELLADAVQVPSGSSWLQTVFTSAKLLPYACPDISGHVKAAEPSVGSVTSPTAAAAFVTAPVTGMSLGRLALITSGRVPALQAAVALRYGMASAEDQNPSGYGPWETCVVWHPYNVPSRVAHYHPLQLACPGPHSDAEESHRLACESSLLSSGRAEEDVDRRRAMEERKKADAGRELNKDKDKGADSLGSFRLDKGEKLPGLPEPNEPVPFSPAGWPTGAALVAAALAACPPRALASVFPTAMAYISTHAPQLSATLPATAPCPHATVLPVGTLTVSCNGPAAAGGVTIATNQVGISGLLLASNGSSYRLSVGSKDGALASAVRPPVGPGGPVSYGTSPARPGPGQAGAGSGINSFSSSATFATVTPAALSSLIIALQPQLQAHSQAVSASAAAGGSSSSYGGGTSPQLGPSQGPGRGGLPADSLSSLANRLAGAAVSGRQSITAGSPSRPGIASAGVVRPGLATALAAPAPDMVTPVAGRRSTITGSLSGGLASAALASMATPTAGSAGTTAMAGRRLLGQTGPTPAATPTTTTAAPSGASGATSTTRPPSQAGSSTVSGQTAARPGLSTSGGSFSHEAGATPGLQRSGSFGLAVGLAACGPSVATSTSGSGAVSSLGSSSGSLPGSSLPSKGGFGLGEWRQLRQGRVS